MIITCEQCQTRFKIPDEKVKDRGVKVRCTRCQHTFRVYRPETSPALSGEGQQVAEHTRPGFFAEGVAASRTQTLPLTPFEAHKELPEEVFSQPTKVMSAANLAKALPAAHALSPPPGFDPADPFGGLGAGATAAAAPGSPVEGPTSIGFDPSDPFGPLGAAGPAAPHGAGPFSDSPFGGPGELFTELSAPAPKPAAPPQEPSAAPSFDFEAPGGGLLGDLEPPPQEPDRGLFELPPPPAPAAPPPPAPAPAPAPAGSARPPIITPSGAQPRPAATPQAPKPAGSSAARRVLALAANLVMGAVLAAALAAVAALYLGEGVLDLRRLSWASVQRLLEPPRGLLAVDVSNGLYETRGGRPLLYVRGQVENRTAHAAAVKVRVELVDGELALQSGEAMAGSPPSAEDLHGIDGPAALVAMAERLALAAPQLAPGARAPFAVAFYDYPPELSQYRLRVVVEAAERAER
jgi:predicted Zn finger-like uncharacterized protein